MRTCKCGNPARNRTSSYCKSCHNEYQKAYYKRNPLSTNGSFQKRKAAIRKLVTEAKDRPCMDCGERYPYYVMDLDHVRGTKSFDLSVAGRHMKSLATVQKEIDKCDVICANCHRKRTFNR